jgi:hypothetical protein
LSLLLYVLVLLSKGVPFDNGVFRLDLLGKKMSDGAERTGIVNLVGGQGKRNLVRVNVQGLR